MVKKLSGGENYQKSKLRQFAMHLLKQKSGKQIKMCVKLNGLKKHQSVSMLAKLATNSSWLRATLSLLQVGKNDFGTTYLTVISDKDGNTIKYKGKYLADKGFGVKMIATIKSHEEYKGEKQTIVNRPRKIEIVTLATSESGNL